jgi:DNA-binding protein HU-beta
MMIFTQLIALFCSLSFTVAFVPAMQHYHNNAAGAVVRRMAADSTSTTGDSTTTGDVETFKKPDFIASVAAKTGMNKKESEDAIKAVIETIQEQVGKNKRVALPGFGIFSLRQRAARNGRNPQTGEKLEIKATRTPGFSASKTWKDLVKAPKV